MKNTPCLFDEKQTTEGMVSVSQLQTYMSCKKKWEYNYIDGIMPRVDRAYLTIGKLCHKGMQMAMDALWRTPTASLDELTRVGINAIAKQHSEYRIETPLLDEEVPEFEQLLEDAVSVFRQELEEFNPKTYEVVTLVKDGERIPALELHFKVPCPPTKGLHGYIDAILKDKTTGFVWCVDYKHRKSLSPDEDEAFNIQNAVYSYACMKMGVQITGTMTWQHVNTPAADPQILKNGAVSRSKIKTTWERFSSFCVENGIDPSAYEEEMVPKLADIEWYRSTLEYRNEQTVKAIWESCVKPAAREVRKAHGKNAVNYRSLYPWNCKMCQYQSLCQASLRGYDEDAIRNREYKRRENTSPLRSDISSLPSDD